MATVEAPTGPKILSRKGMLIPGPKAFNRDLELQGSDKWPPASYPQYLPTWDEEQNYPPLEPFEHVEHGKGADGTFASLLCTADSSQASIRNLTHTIGAEIDGSNGGVQLSKLGPQGKDQLALLAARRKVLVFRDQDFANLPIQEALDWGGYYGRHHIHPTNGSPAGFPEIQIAHRGAGDKGFDEFYSARTNSVAWHCDVTYEEQPPGTTIMYVLDTPKVGGDTIFSDQVALYNRLSPEFKKRLYGMRALHSSLAQADYNLKKGGIVRREPVETIHPVVRTHPATGEKALFVNKQFTRRIIDLKQEESDFLLGFLFHQMAYNADHQCRVNWKPGTVVVWDNRVTAHTAILDWNTRERRHLARITPQAERPFETPFE